jgi:hypothetical protein
MTKKQFLYLFYYGRGAGSVVMLDFIARAQADGATEIASNPCIMQGLQPIQSKP